MISPSSKTFSSLGSSISFANVIEGDEIRARIQSATTPDELLSALGDVLHTLPALTDAQQAIPGIKFDWVVEEESGQFVKYEVRIPTRFFYRHIPLA